MDTISLTNLLAEDPFSQNSFHGVFAADQLPVRVSLPSAVIANTDESVKDGQHWTAFYINEHREGEFFDSYGLRPSVAQHKHFLDRNAVLWFYNDVQLQALNSTVCGHYCAVYLALRCRNIPMHNIVNILRSGISLDSNDRNVLTLFNTIFRKRNHICSIWSPNCHCVQSCCSRGHFA